MKYSMCTKGLYYYYNIYTYCIFGVGPNHSKCREQVPKCDGATTGGFPVGVSGLDGSTKARPHQC